MSVIVGFTIIIMILFLGYMAYRLFLRRRLHILASFCLQIIALTIGIISFTDNVQSTQFVESFYILFGVAIPAAFFVYDYTRMMKKIKDQGVYEGFVVPLPKDLEYENTLNLNKKYINPIIKERQVSELSKHLNLNKDDILKNIKKSLTQAQAFLNGKDYDNAYDIYGTLVKLIKNCPELFFNYANICYHKENYAEAAQSYKKALEINEKIVRDMNSSKQNQDNDGFASIGKDLLDSSKTEEEIRYEEYMVYYNLGNAQFKLNKFEVAMESYRKALELNPGLDDANENIARALISLERVPEAISYYKKIVDGDKNNFKVHYIIGKLYSETKKYSDAEEALNECIRLNSSFKEAYETLGAVRTKLGKHSEAIDAYRKIVKMDPEDYKAFYNLGTSYYKSGEKEKAVEAFKKVVEIKPDNYKSLYNMAVALEELEQQEEAISTFRKAIELKVDFIDAYNNLGILLSTLDRHLEALDVYIKGLKKNPDEFSLYYNMGITLSDMNRYEEAVESYKNALDIKPDEYEIHYHLAAALTELKKYSEAIEAYKGAMKFKPDNSELYYNISTVYSILKKYDISMDNLKKAIELNEEYKEDARTNKAFDGLRKRQEFKELVS